jgi:hypothetical protein
MLRRCGTAAILIASSYSQAFERIVLNTAFRMKLFRKSTKNQECVYKAAQLVIKMTEHTCVAVYCILCELQLE